MKKHIDNNALHDTLNNIERAEQYFRLGMHASGSNELLSIIDYISQILPNCSTDDTNTLNAILYKIIQSQESNDMLGTADILFYELFPYIMANSSQTIYKKN